MTHDSWQQNAEALLDTDCRRRLKMQDLENDGSNHLTENCAWKTADQIALYKLKDLKND